MNAEPLLRRIVRAATAAKLEVIIIGNAGAALNGAPVTTLDFDLFVRDTAAQMPKIRAFARHLDATVLPAASPMSNLVKVENEALSLYIDIIDEPSGMRSFTSVRRRGTEVRLGDSPSFVYLASLKDIIESKKKLGRPKDLAVLPVLEMTLDEQTKLAQAEKERGSRS